MSKQIIKTISISTSVNPGFLEETLTQDITPLESIFDLIDNSIDAARDDLFRSEPSLDDYGLPIDYSAYSIHIRIDEDSVRVLDNCLGIDENILAQKTFRVAEPSGHEFGIGHYGLGLKRSLLKLGSEYGMSTDTGKDAFFMKFSNKSFGGQTSLPLKATQYKTNNRKKVLFSVSKLKSNIKHEIKQQKWFENAVDQLSVRYASYLTKGLGISIRSIPHKKSKVIKGSIPLLRDDARVKVQRKNYDEDGVKIFIDAGIHAEHIFKSEENHLLTNTREISKEFGLYFICNDRVIVAASCAKDHGFKTGKWHSEYNGFVCIVRFVSQDSSKMPWNTAKTALKTDSTLFLKIRSDIQPIADFYRGEIKKQYPSTGKEKQSKIDTNLSVNHPTNSTVKNQKSPNQHQQNFNFYYDEKLEISIKQFLHPLIHETSYHFFLNGHYREAVLNSFVAIFDLVRERTGLDLDGARLAQKAFSADNPLLMLSDTSTDSGRNEQTGFMNIFCGAYQGIRNPNAHTLEHDLNQNKAAQYLIFASLLAARVTEAKKAEMETI